MDKRMPELLDRAQELHALEAKYRLTAMSYDCTAQKLDPSCMSNNHSERPSQLI